jgi:hypothetical protein
MFYKSISGFTGGCGMFNVSSREVATGTGLSRLLNKSLTLTAGDTPVGNTVTSIQHDNRVWRAAALLALVHDVSCRADFLIDGDMIDGWSSKCMEDGMVSTLLLQGPGRLVEV